MAEVYTSDKKGRGLLVTARRRIDAARVVPASTLRFGRTKDDNKKPR